MRRHMRVGLASCISGLACGIIPALAGEMPPNGELRVAYRQSEGGKLSESVHHVALGCSDGRCSLTTLTLNQCSWGRFYPKIEQAHREGPRPDHPAVDPDPGGSGDRMIEPGSSYLGHVLGG